MNASIIAAIGAGGGDTSSPSDSAFSSVLGSGYANASYSLGATYSFGASSSFGEMPFFIYPMKPATLLTSPHLSPFPSLSCYCVSVLASSSSAFPSGSPNASSSGFSAAKASSSLGGSSWASYLTSTSSLA